MEKPAVQGVSNRRILDSSSVPAVRFLIVILGALCFTMLFSKYAQAGSFTSAEVIIQNTGVKNELSVGYTVKDVFLEKIEIIAQDLLLPASENLTKAHSILFKAAMATLEKLDSESMEQSVFTGFTQNIEQTLFWQIIMPVFLLAGFFILFLLIIFWLVRKRLLARIAELSKENQYMRDSVLQSSKLASIGKLAAGVAHEVNNPLMLIKQTAGWIKDLMEDESPKRMKNYQEILSSAGKIEKHVDRTRDIVHRLLGFARKDTHILGVSSLDSIVDQTLSFLKNEAAFRNVHISYEACKTDLKIKVDTGQLQQVLLNLVNNALDAVPAGGKVMVVTQHNQNQACIIVQDNGSGLPPDIFNKLFEPFFTTKSPGQGTGLGLSICQSIIKDMGGTLKAGNRPEGGAEFVVCLPLVQE